MDTIFASHYDAGTSTLQLTGTYDRDAWSQVHAEVDRAFRRTACHLIIDLSQAEGVPARNVGNLVHLCNSCYPGTTVRARAGGYLPAA